MVLSTLRSNNQLLASLSDTEWSCWQPWLELVELPAGKLLFEAGRQIEHVHFPLTALVALSHVTESGASAELALVGHEGLVGVSSFMGGGGAISHAVVLCAGQALRLPASAMLGRFAQSSQVQRLMLSYTQALIAQMSQTAVCNRHHTIEQALSRWLLLSLDRVPGQDLRMTQETIANMLGVRREGVTEAALKLQAAGLIRYARGRITLLDRQGLEGRTCECYHCIKAKYGHLLPEPVPLRSPHAAATRLSPLLRPCPENAVG